MKKVLYPLSGVAALALTSPISFGDTMPQPDPTLDPLTSTSYEFDWSGEKGWSYFLQISPDLTNWVYLPEVESGESHDAYTFTPQIPGTSQAAPYFFTRLKMSDQPVADKVAAEIADFDGDGLPNLAELQLNGDLDPLEADTDGDGTRDGAEDNDGNGLGDLWEIVHFGSVGQDPSADPDGDGLSNLEEFAMASNPTTDSFRGTHGSEYYEYDALDRLEKVKGISRHSFQYDPSGNLEKAE